MKLHTCFLLMMFWVQGGNILQAQLRVGINTDNPVRNFEVRGEGEQNICVVTTSGFTGGTGLELVSGNNFVIDTDWRILNESGGLKFFTGDYNANFYNVERLRFNNAGSLGIGTGFPAARLHIDGGTVTTQGGGGYLTLGSTTAQNMAFDNTQIRTRLNGMFAPLYIQPYDGHTYVGIGGGNVYLANAYGPNKVGIGTATPTSRVSVQDNLYQLYLRNDADDVNDWYIGASGASWGVGADQLIFAPTSSSTSSVFRLLSVTDNNGDVAPVIIQSSASQRLLLDGNEIETASDGLYINHNSAQETYFNVNGGDVGIGTTSPESRLHIKVTGSGQALSMERGDRRWNLNPVSNLAWSANGWNMAHVDGVSGQWNAISDARMKTQIRDYGTVLNKLMQVSAYQYTFRHDPEKRQYIGVIAQELKEQFPELVLESHDQLGVTYGPLAVVVVDAIKEQQEIIDKLRQKITLLRDALAGSAQEKP